MTFTKKYGISSFVVSCLLHLGAIFFLQRYIHLTSFSPPSSKEEKELSLVPWKEIVTTKLSPTKTPTKQRVYTPAPEPISFSAPSFSISSLIKPPSSSQKEISLQENPNLSASLVCSLSPPFIEPREIPSPHLGEIPKQVIFTPPAPKKEENFATYAPTPQSLSDPIPSPKTPPPYKEGEPVKWEEDFFIKKETLKKASTPSKKSLQAPRVFPSYYASLPMLPGLKDLHTISCEEWFDLDVVFMPEQEGYCFAITLIPKTDIPLPRLKQHLFFLIDTSNAIQKDRLKITQDATIRSFSYLEEGDTFNILAYDHKVKKLSSQSLPINAEEKSYAKGFLKDLRLGNLFTLADPFKPLNLLLFEPIPEEEIGHIFLITNGDGISNQSKNPYFIHSWTGQNQGKYVLNILSLAEDNNLSLLDAFATLNKGQLYLSITKSGLKRKLQKMVKSTSSPLAKDLMLTPISSAPNLQIELLPSTQTLPILYAGQPFVIWGKAPSLENFTLFLQGKNKNKWLNFKKKISLQEAKLAPSHLMEKWALQKAYYYYELYFKEGDSSHLLKANDILRPYQLEAAFQEP